MLKTPLIVAVDDDEAVGEAIKELLEAAGFSAETYPSAEEFLRSGRLDRATCLVTDISMPGMSGVDLMKRLTALGYRIPAIVVTGYANDRTRKEAIAAGAICVLPKPLAKAELLSSLRQLLNRDHGPESQGAGEPGDGDSV